jgi:SPP1 family predicted phage head-tail adaptor
MPRIYEGAGPKRHRVSIQGQAIEIDSYGQETKVWATTSTRWAHVETTAGAFVSNAGQQKDNITHQVTMRWFPGLDPTMRIIYGSRILNIFYINDVDERHREYVVKCQEIVGTTA